MISVITINLNNAAGLEKTIKSLPFNKTTFEHIIIDGASTDRSLEIIKNNLHPNTQFISERDTGVYNAMNKGISMARGEYIQFLNSGDSLLDKNTFLHLNELTNTNCIYYGDQLRGASNRKDEYPKKLRLSHLLFHGGLAHQTQFIPRAFFDLVGFYDENERIISDWKWNIQAFLSHQIPFEHLNSIVCHYEDNGMSSAGSRLHEKAIADQEHFLATQMPQIKDDYAELREARTLISLINNSRIYKFATWIFNIKKQLFHEPNTN